MKTRIKFKEQSAYALSILDSCVKTLYVDHEFSDIIAGRVKTGDFAFQDGLQQKGPKNSAGYM